MSFPSISLLTEVHPLVFSTKEDLTLYMFKNVFLLPKYLSNSLVASNFLGHILFPCVFLNITLLPSGSECCCREMCL